MNVVTASGLRSSNLRRVPSQSNASIDKGEKKESAENLLEGLLNPAMMPPFRILYNLEVLF